MSVNSFIISGFPADTSEAEVKTFIEVFGDVLHFSFDDSGVVQVEFAKTKDAKDVVLSSQSDTITFGDALLTFESVSNEQPSRVIRINGEQKNISKEDINRVILQKVKVMKYLLLNGDESFDLYVEFPDRAAAIAFKETFDKGEIAHEFGDPDVRFTFLEDLNDVVSDDLKMAIDLTDFYVEDADLDEDAEADDDENAAPADGSPAVKVDLEAFVDGTVDVMEAAKRNKSTVVSFKSNQGTGVILFGKRGVGRRVKTILDRSPVRKMLRKADENMSPDKLKAILRIAASQEVPTLVVLLEIEKAPAGTRRTLSEFVEGLSAEHASVWVLCTTTSISSLLDNLATMFTTIYLSELTD